MEYVLNLSGNLDEKLRKIGINNTQQLNTWARVEQQVASANRTMSQMGRSMGSIQERISALRAQREWIPSSNREAIRATNREIKKLESEMRKLENLNGGRLQGWFNQLKSSVPILNAVTNPLMLIGAGMYKLSGYIKESTELYRNQSIAEQKLAAVMNNTMGASRDEMNSILELASAQQKLGVIGDEVQLAGAQEMATYLGEKASLEKLLPALNDMLAQQYGLNATQEQAATIGMMLGKVMQGQTWALSRYGYAFDEAQAKILKTGTEAERVAVLFDVVTGAVGGVNAALAATPEGQLKQLANSAGDLQERMGKIVVSVQSAFSGIQGKLQGVIDRILSYLEKNMDVIMRAVNGAARVVEGAFSALGTSVRIAWDAFTGLLTVMQYILPVLGLVGVYLVAINASFIAFSIQFYAYTAWLGIVAVATKIWTAAQAVLNVVLTANPVGLIVVGIAALIGLIVFLAIKLKGWGTLWEAVIGFMKNIGLAFVESMKLAFNGMVNGIMIAIDKIKLGWYGFKKAVGLGDADENEAMIAKINNDVETRKQAIVDGAKKVAEYSTAAVKSWDKLDMSWDSKITMKSTTDKLKSQLGINDNTKVINNTTTDTTTTSLSQDLTTTTNSISSGGRSVKNFNITINDGLINRVDNHFGSASDNPESATDFMWRLSQALQMILNDVNYAGN
jgi:hypothetical protein